MSLEDGEFKESCGCTRSLVGAVSSLLECAGVLNEAMVVPFLLYGRENGMEGGER